VDDTTRAAVLAVHNDTVAADDPLWHLMLDRAMHKHRVHGRAVIDRWRAEPRRPHAPPAGLALEPLGREHWDDVRRILEAGISTGDATLDPEAPDWERFDEVHRRDGRYVAVAGGKVVGWTALSPYSKRDVYAGVAWERVYVASEAQGRGVGRALLEHLIAQTDSLGIWTLQAGVIRENGRSLALHRRVGFRVVGVQERLGRDAHGQWRDVVLLQWRNPAEPVTR
jgi:phosphinothricin acetyltransferase